MSDTKKNQIDRISRYADLIQKQTGKAVRPYRADGYRNMMNKYGTARDSTEQYTFVNDGLVEDDLLSNIYEGNGLFARIIDTPAEDAVRHGFTLKDLNDKKIEEFYSAALDELDWEETAITCLKWARLFGGSMAVMLINDGRGLEEPLDWRRIKSVDDIRVFDRSVIQPDSRSLYSYDPRNPFASRGSRLGMPEYYYVSSIYGSFTVHESRCLIFRNGVLPERTTTDNYRLWGMPEYVRIHRALRDAEVAHGSAVKMLDRSVQAVYKMKDLSMELATDEGENNVLRRLQVIDMARGLLNSIAIDGDGEEYDFRTFQFAGVSDVIDATCNYLSALTTIPQTVLFGRAISGMSSADNTTMENYYNTVGRIQGRDLRSNLRYLLSVLFQAGRYTGEVDRVPHINVQFNPLWSLSELEQADLDLKKAQIRQANAAVATGYMQENVLSREEVRKSLVKSGDFDVEETFDDEDDEESMAELIQKMTDNGGLAPSDGSSPDAAPAATKLPQDMNDGDLAQTSIANAQGVQEPPTSLETTETDEEDTTSPSEENYGSVGVIVINEGKILVAVRNHEVGNGLICGPGGHIEKDETPIMAAARETNEEFGIIPNELIPFGRGPAEPETGFAPYLFLCTDYEGTPASDEDEMVGATFLSLEELHELDAALFAPFADSLNQLQAAMMGEVREDAQSEKGEWITTKNGHRVHLNEEGVPDKGNPHVIEKMAESGNESSNIGHAGQIGKIGSSITPFDSGSVNVSVIGERLPKEKADNLLSLAGCSTIQPTKSDIVRIRSYGNRNKVAIRTEKVDLTVIARDNDNEIVLDEMFLQDRGTGKGTEIFGDIVSNAKQQGYDRIMTTAAGMGGDDSMNGYYTWPRLGFDTELPKSAIDRAKAEGFDVKRLSDLMKTSDGRKYWKENGFCLELEFDLSDDSYSMETLKEYVSGRKDENGLSISHINSDAGIENHAEGINAANSETTLTDTVFMLREALSSTSALHRKISERREIILDNPQNQDTITVKNQTDGAPDGNRNAAGPHKRSHLSKADTERYSKRLVGQKTSDGITVSKITPHAFDRIAQRNLSAARIEDMLRSSNVSPDKNHPNRRCYDTKGSRLVLDHTDGTIVTIEWRKQNK